MVGISVGFIVGNSVGFMVGPNVDSVGLNEGLFVGVSVVSAVMETSFKKCPMNADTLIIERI